VGGTVTVLAEILDNGIENVRRELRRKEHPKHQQEGGGREGIDGRGRSEKTLKDQAGLGRIIGKNSICKTAGSKRPSRAKGPA